MIRLNELTVPGRDGKKELKTYLWLLLIFVILWSLTFYISYFNARSALYTVYRGELILIKNKLMVPFHTLVKGRFTGAGAYIVFCLSMAAYNFASFRSGSKSIYLMKRLPKKHELLKRTVVLPMTAIAACLILSVLLFLLYRTSYLSLTPAGHFPQGDIYSLKEVLL